MQYHQSASVILSALGNNAGMKDTQNITPNRLKYWRKKRGLTLEKAAELMSFTPQSLQRYENGSRQVNIRTLWQIARAYDTTPAALISDDFDELNQEEQFILRRIRENPHATPLVRSVLQELRAYDETKANLL